MESNVLNFEPHEAIFVPDSDPLKFYKRIAVISAEHLKKDGTLYLEINPKFADDTKNLFIKAGFSECTITLDSYGKKRFLICKF